MAPNADGYISDKSARLRLPPDCLNRNGDQRSAFGNFCMNAASTPLPDALEHRTTASLSVCFIRRKFLGLNSPIVNALVEPRGAAAPNDVWQVAEAALPLLDDSAPSLVKLFLAGSVPAGSPDLRRVVGPGGDYIGAFFPVHVAEAIELTDSYEKFLGALGGHTRRNMRRGRRQAESAGMTFEVLPASMNGIIERYALAGATHPKPFRPKHIDAYDTFLTAQAHGFHALLRAPSGELLSCCAGLLSDGTAIVLYQLNHRLHLKASLSLTTRAFLIEELTRRGVGELVLPGGGEGLLTRIAHVRRSGELALIRRSAIPILKSLALTVLSPHSTLGLAARRWAQHGGL